MQFVVKNYLLIIAFLDRLAPIVPLLLLRLLLAWEFGEAGYQKLTGENWFAHVEFPFPFSIIPTAVNWQMATWFELLGAAALALGLATRFFAISLIILTIVAIAAVHWPSEWDTLGQLLRGYRIIDEGADGFGNYKLPVIFLAMLVPLVFSGAEKSSLDAWISKLICNGK
ncbi:thiosulfate dehydrogenase [quinone] large subunit [Methylophilaceae bacterium]|nr:thiosulfate dehydrogenase [quinone] large subunit [Methylophilaceae bacterium]